MKFEELIDEISKGNENLYLTTQELVYDFEGRPELISPPIEQLKSDLPIIPSLFGNLIVSNINLWFGNSVTKKSSSGLHHDFHDNLYILLRGEKEVNIII